jgi:hypothetical protein
MMKKPGSDLAKSASGDCRDPERGKAQARQLEECLQLGLDVADQVGLVCDHQRGKPQRERIVVFTGVPR